MELGLGAPCRVAQECFDAFEDAVQNCSAQEQCEPLDRLDLDALQAGQLVTCIGGVCSCDLLREGKTCKELSLEGLVATGVIGVNIVVALAVFTESLGLFIAMRRQEDTPYRHSEAAYLCACAAILVLLVHSVLNMANLLNVVPQNVQLVEFVVFISLDGVLSISALFNLASIWLSVARSAHNLQEQPKRYWLAWGSLLWLVVIIVCSFLGQFVLAALITFVFIWGGTLALLIGSTSVLRLLELTIRDSRGKVSVKGLVRAFFSSAPRSLDRDNPMRRLSRRILTATLRISATVLLYSLCSFITIFMNGPVLRIDAVRIVKAVALFGVDTANILGMWTILWFFRKSYRQRLKSAKESRNPSDALMFQTTMTPQGATKAPSNTLAGSTNEVPNDTYQTTSESIRASIVGGARASLAGVPESPKTRRVSSETPRISI